MGELHIVPLSRLVSSTRQVRSNAASKSCNCKREKFLLYIDRNFSRSNLFDRMHRLQPCLGFDHFGVSRLLRMTAACCVAAADRGTSRRCASVTLDVMLAIGGAGSAVAEG